MILLSPLVFVGLIDIAAQWMSDLKEGVCSSVFYYDRSSCCWLSNDTTVEIDYCSAWYSWSLRSGVNNSTTGYVLNYFLYILFSVLFAGLSGAFVIFLAPYAAGSGIPEV